MKCDIKTVIAILYKQLVSSSVGTYQALVDMLFKSYFNDPTSPEYDRSEPSKLNKGTRTLSSNITDFYVRKDIFCCSPFLRGQPASGSPCSGSTSGLRETSAFQQ